MLGSCGYHSYRRDTRPAITLDGVSDTIFAQNRNLPCFGPCAGEGTDLMVIQELYRAHDDSPPN